jgi:DNA adenine methylase
MSPRSPLTRPASPPDGRVVPRPFLKWVGGKGQLLSQLWPMLPGQFGRYIEPFLGGAALFFALRPARAVLSDVNEELIDCYRSVRDDVDGVIAALGKHRHDRDHFYAVRGLDPSALPLPERAARTIFLNRTGFNGLYRVNSSGRFNVPFGSHRNPTICDEANLRACSLALRGVRLEVRDFGKVARSARRGDLVYFDPPYAPVSSTSDFTAYAAGGFGWEQQERLAAVFGRLARRGVQVLMSNSDVPTLHALYEGFPLRVVHAARAINSVASKRGRVREIVVRGYP